MRKDENIEFVGKLRLDVSQAEVDAENYAKTVSEKISKQGKGALKDVPVSVDPTISNLKSFQSQLTKSIEDIKVPVGLDTGISEKMKAFQLGDMGLKEMESALAEINGVLGSVTKSTSSLGDVNKMLSGLSRGLTGVARALGPVGAAITVLFMALKGTDTMTAISEQFSSIMSDFQEMLAPILSITGDIAIVLMQMVQDLLPVLQPILDNLSFSLKIFSVILESIAPIITEIGKAFENFYGIVKDIVKFLTFGLVDLGSITGSTTGLKQPKGFKSSLDIWETTGSDTTLKDIDSTLTDGVKKEIQRLQDGVSVIDKDMQEIQKQIERAIDAGDTAEIEKLQSLLLDKENEMKTAIDNLNNVLTEKYPQQNIANINVTVPEEKKEKSFGEKVKDAFVSVTDWLSDVGWSILGKGWLWEDGGTLPLYAGGGEIGAQVWGMSEKGNPEFLFNSGGHTSVINADALEQAVYNALVRGEKSKSQEIKVSIKEGTPSGPRELVQWILPSLKFFIN